MENSSSPKLDWLSRLVSKTMAGPLPLLILLIAIAGRIIALTDLGYRELVPEEELDEALDVRRMTEGGS